MAQPIRIDWTQATETTFEAKAPGKYAAKVSGIQRKTSQNGNPYLEVEFTFQPPETGKAWHNITLIPSTLWRLKQFLLATGKYTAEHLSGDGFEFVPESVLGSDVILVTTVETYEGKERTRVKDVLAYDPALVGSDDW